MESDTCSMDSYIEQTNLKLQKNIVNDVKGEIDSLSLEVGTLDSRLADLNDKTISELNNLDSKMKRIEDTNSMIKSELEELNSKMVQMEIVITKVDAIRSLLVDYKVEILRELDELESNIGDQLDKLHGQKCTCECSGMEPPTEYVTLPSSPSTKPSSEPSTKPPTKPPTEPPTEPSTEPSTEPPTEPPSPCEGTGWKRVAYLNMTDPGASCPHAWKLHTFDDKRVCGKLNSAPKSCDPTTFSVGKEEYSQVCGMIKAYQFEKPLGFKTYFGPPVTIDGRYADGVSLTHGSPRQHIWTFAAQTFEGQGYCPCNLDEQVEAPSFVRNDYFCESGVNVPYYVPPLGFVSTDPLWDGKGCIESPCPGWDGKDCTESPCCSFNNPPYFLKTLRAPTTEDIEARICLRDPPDLSDIMVEEIELYIR